MTKWKIYSTNSFDNEFKKLDRSVQVLIRKWIKNHLEDVDDPRFYGKPLKENLSGYWSYRIGDYRLISEIKDYELIILMIRIGHRSKVYKG